MLWKIETDGKTWKKDAHILFFLTNGEWLSLENLFLSKFIETLDELITKVYQNKVPIFYMNNVSAAAYIYILRILYVILSNQQNLKFERKFSSRSGN